VKVATIVGARPQFIKAAPVSRALRLRHCEVLVHTGQHYDPLLSAVFFRELALPAPDHTLYIGSAPHGAQTGRMLEAVEAVLLLERPDVVLVYGDTNSTLAGALAAAKLDIPLVHVEAGLRSGVRAMPEEINRVLTDRLSTLSCCPNQAAVDNLAAEGLTRNVEIVGDVMLDALLEAAERVQEDAPGRLGALGISRGPYALATVHRAANTDDPVRLGSIVRALGSLGMPVLWPMHPRTRPILQAAGIDMPPTVHVVPALGYLDLVRVLRHAACVVTDSGGLQKEAYWLGVPCVTTRNETEWRETVSSGWNTLADADTARIVAAVAARPSQAGPREAYGAPGAAERVVEAMERVIRAT
jgi:UDP-GlcNAc3NAcA epimerase